MGQKRAIRSNAGLCDLDGRWINREQVVEGWVWHYKDFYESAVLAEAEDQGYAWRDGFGRSMVSELLDRFHKLLTLSLAL